VSARLSFVISLSSEMTASRAGGGPEPFQSRQGGHEEVLSTAQHSRRHFLGWPAGQWSLSSGGVEVTRLGAEVLHQQRGDAGEPPGITGAPSPWLRATCLRSRSVGHAAGKFFFDQVWLEDFEADTVLCASTRNLMAELGGSSGWPRTGVGGVGGLAELDAENDEASTSPPA